MFGMRVVDMHMSARMMVKTLNESSLSSLFVIMLQKRAVLKAQYLGRNLFDKNVKEGYMDEVINGTGGNAFVIMHGLQGTLMV